MKFKQIKGLAVGAGLLVGSSLMGVASATDYVVVVTDDTSGSASTLITLRDAIIAANTNAVSGQAPAGEADGDTITILAAGNIVLTAPLPTIEDDLTITSTPATTIDGGLMHQILSVDTTETVTLTGLVLTQGTAADGGALNVAAGSTVVATDLTVTDSKAEGGTAATQGGGAVFNAGTLTLNNPTLTDNTAISGSLSGGAINNTGTLIITDGTITDNEANRAGGGIENTGEVTMTGVTLDDNVVNTSPGNGGGFHTGGTGTLVMTGGTVNGNTAGAEGGGLWNSGVDSEMTITDTTIDGNTASGDPADQGGGGVFNGGAGGDGGTLTLTNVTITNNVADGTSGSGGGILNFGGELVINGGVITGNTASRAGGGIETANGSATASVEMEDVTLDTNSTGSNPGNGGGLHMSQASTVTITGGTINGNTAAAEGGGVWNGGGNSVMTITDTTINNNTASGNDTAQGGGGAFNGGAAGDGGTLTLNNVTMVSNVADGVAGSTAGSQAGNGGAVLNFGGTLEVNGGMMDANTSVRAGGAIETTDGSTVTIEGTTIINNETGPMPGNGGGLHMSGTATVTINRDTAINSNVAASEGGGLWNGGGSSVMTLNGPILLDDNEAQGTDANMGGGAIFNGGAGNSGGTVTLDKVTLTNNSATGSDSDSAGSGGAVLNSGGTLTVTNSVFSGNSAVRAGGAIEDNGTVNAVTTSIENTTVNGNSAGSMPGNGGGFHITGAGTVNVSNSTFSDNTAAKEGGGLWNHANATMTITNSTVSGNRANGSATGGGGVFTQGGAGSTILNFVTVANNEANIGGGVQSTNGSMAITNSVIADNNADTGVDTEGDVTVSNSVVEIQDDQINATNVTYADPGLDSLTDNGGLTQTQALTMGSAAMDLAGVDCTGITLDQRGATRDNNCDAGAYELVAQVIGAASSNTGDDVAVAPGATDVAALGFTLSNPAGSGNLTLNGFSGDLSERGRFGDEVTSVQVFADVDGDGAVGSGDNQINAMVSLSQNTGTFDVEFASPVTIADGASASFVLAVSFDNSFALASTPIMMAGGVALLFAVPFMFTGWRRRGLFAVVTGLAVVALAGCGDSANSSSGGNSLQFTMTKVDAEDASGTPVLFVPLPLEGPVLTAAE